MVARARVCIGIWSSWAQKGYLICIWSQASLFSVLSVFFFCPPFSVEWDFYCWIGDLALRKSIPSLRFCAQLELVRAVNVVVILECSGRGVLAVGSWCADLQSGSTALILHS